MLVLKLFNFCAGHNIQNRTFTAPKWQKKKKAFLAMKGC